MKTLREVFYFLLLMTGATPAFSQWNEPDTYIRSLVVAPNGLGGTNVFAGTQEGVFISTDTAANFSVVNTGLTDSVVYALSVSPNGTGGTNLFVGTNAGVFLSTNNGTNWSAASAGLPLTAINAFQYGFPPIYTLAVSTNGAGGAKLFAGAYDAWSIGGVFLSNDLGTSWSDANTGISNKYVSTLAVSPNGTGGTYLFAGTKGSFFSWSSLYSSTDNGTSWIETPLTECYILSLAVSPNGAGGINVFAGTDRGVFLSTNHGTSWNAVNAGLTNTFVSALAVSPNWSGSANLFAGTNGGVFLSTDNGTSWVDLGITNTGVTSLAISSSHLFAGSFNYQIYKRPMLELIPPAPPAPALTSPADGTTGVPTSIHLAWNASSRAVSYQLQVSINSSFSNFFVKPNGLTSTSYDLSGLANNTTYYWRVNATNAGGPSAWSATKSFTTNAVPPGPGITSWVNVGLNNNVVKALAVSQTGNVFAASDSGVFRSTNNGTNWIKNALTNRYVDAFAVSPTGNIFAGTTGDGVYLSTNDGASWSAVNVGLTYTYVYALTASSNGSGGTNLFAGTAGGGVFRSSDNGLTWSEASNGLSTPGVATSVRALAVSPSFGGSGTNLFAGIEGGGIFVSTDNGTNWIAASTGLTNLYIRAIAVAPNGAGNTNLFAGTWSGIFRSTDNGMNWTPTNSGLPTLSLNVFSLAVSPNGRGGSNLFAGTFGSVYLSTDNGTSWGAVDTGLTFPSVWNLALSPGGVEGAILFAGTYDGGVWRRVLSGMISSVPADGEETNMPLQSHLEQNYPNPFNPTTVISYQLSVVSKANLRVYDLLGREVAVLVNEEKMPGTYSVTWNAEGMASGVYLYRLQAGDHVQSKQLIVLK